MGVYQKLVDANTESVNTLVVVEVLVVLEVVVLVVVVVGVLEVLVELLLRHKLGLSVKMDLP
jgi:hypothetical protein